MRSFGSSPRMRGKPTPVITQTVTARIIPAHAGQTPRPCSTRLLGPDHPRACGANALFTGGAMAWNGSSPRMRGKRRVLRVDQIVGRIIPAHAGQTRPRVICVALKPDHPRACGANGNGRGRPTDSAGSSPRMRGKPMRWIEQASRIRIIPAHAGQTDRLFCMMALTTDHPRACGANPLPGPGCCRDAGSSPRMRGKLSQVLQIYGQRRIIPAHAGQTTPAYPIRP